MHIPPIFEITDRNVIEHFIKENGFATLITMGSDFPTGTHIPVELESKTDGRKILAGHIAKENTQWLEFEKAPDVLVIFLSPINHYISSSWYNHPNAPTWNYISIHVTGKLRIIEGKELWDSVSRLTNKYERKSKCPVSLDTLPKLRCLRT